MKIAYETTVILNAMDVADILTGTVCTYNAFADLQVEDVVANAEGDFVLTMRPKPTEKEAA
jgi:hypothetical protein